MSDNLRYSEQPPSPAASEPEYDIEKNKTDDVNVTASTGSVDGHQQPFAVQDSVKRDGWMWKISHKLGQYGVEQRGIERILPEERTQKSAWG